MAEESTISRPLTDSDGNEVMRIYSTTGATRSKADFDKALAYAQKNGVAPEGFTILEKGSLSNIARSGFEAVNQPVQRNAPMAGAGLGLAASTSPALLLLQKAGVLPQGTAERVSGVGAKVGEAVARAGAESVNTPGKAGMAAGMTAATPFLGPTTFVGGTGAQSLAKLPLVMNMIKSAIGGATGGALARAATGENVTPGNVGVDAGIAALGGGVAGVTDHILTKYLSPNRAEEVAKGILTKMKDQYPHLAKDPNLLQMAASNREGLQYVSQRMVDGLSGEMDDIVGNLVQNTVQGINTVAPRSFSVSQQNTLRSKTRAFTNHAKDMLDNIDNPTAMAESRQAMFEARDAVVDFVAEQLKNMKAPPNVQKEAIATAIQSIDDASKAISKFDEGARVISALRQSGAQNGFDATRFNDVIAGKYMEKPGSLLNRVGQELGMGQQLTPGATQGPPSLVGEIMNLVKNRIPGLKHVPGLPRGNAATLPWQNASTLGTAGNAGAQLSGDVAIREFAK